jgi:hypothetical protein
MGQGMREMLNAYKIFVRKSAGKTTSARPRYGWVYNINVDLKEIWHEVDWIQLVEEALQWQPFVNMIPVGFIRDKDFHGRLTDCQILLRGISYTLRD